MHIADRTTFQRHQAGPTSVTEVLLTMLVFGSLGAITWAIRGTSGWGGIDGTIVPGIAWGILWWYVCWRKGVDARTIPLWLGLGIALGGELGYGQYVSWIRGLFNLRDEIVPVSPWIGWAWFAICGIGWGAPGGILLGWALAERRSAPGWLARLILPVGAAFLTRCLVQTVPWLFFPNWHLDAYVTEAGGSANPAAAAASQHQMMLCWSVSAALGIMVWLLTTRPLKNRTLTRGLTLSATVPAAALQLVVANWLFFPSDQLGLFEGDLDRHAGRTVYTNSQNIIVVGWWIGALVVAALQKDRFTLMSGLIIGGGFGLGFPISAIWCLGYGWKPQLIDWWKMWELHSGLNLGVLYAILLYWSLRHIGSRSETTATDVESPYERWCRTAATATGGFLIILLMGLDEFPVTGLLLGLLLVAALAAATFATPPSEDRLASTTFIYSVFLLLFIMAFGMTSQLGILLGLYDADAADQYAWPSHRVALFVPAGLVLTGITVRKLWALRHSPSTLPTLSAVPVVSARIIDLMTFAGVVGAVSIWPAKIGACYAVCLAVAIYAFNRLNQRFNSIDATV